MVEPLSALLMTRLQLVASFLSASLSFLVRFLVSVSCCSMLLISSLAAAKASCNALGPRVWILEFVLGLNSAGSSPGLGGLGGLIILLNFLFVLFANMLKSVMSSVDLALSAVGTNDRPLLSTSVCVFVNVMLDRLTILSMAQL